MKKILFLVMFCMLSVRLCAGTVTGVVTSVALNVRLKPNLEKSNSVVATLKKGDEIRVIKEVEGWCEIEIPESAAVWVHGDYLKDNVVQKEIKLRSGPGVAYAPYAITAKSGQKIEVLRKCSDNWVKIKPPQGLTAWVSSEFVKLPEADKSLPKPEEKKEGDKSSAKVEEKKEADSAAKPAEKNAEPSSDKPVEAKTDKEKEPATEVKSSSVTKEGFIVPVTSDMETVTHALASKEKDKYVPICYLRSSKLNLKNWQDNKEKVKITGYESTIPGWKYPIVDVETVAPLR